MAKIVVVLNANRDKPGSLRILDANGRTLLGPVPVLGRAADNDAELAGNPKRNRLFKNGDTPLGTYKVLGIARTDEGTKLAERNMALLELLSWLHYPVRQSKQKNFSEQEFGYMAAKAAPGQQLMKECAEQMAACA